MPGLFVLVRENQRELNLLLRYIYQQLTCIPIFTRKYLKTEFLRSGGTNELLWCHCPRRIVPGEKPFRLSLADPEKAPMLAVLRQVHLVVD